MAREVRVIRFGKSICNRSNWNEMESFSAAYLGIIYCMWEGNVAQNSDPQCSQAKSVKMSQII